MGKTQYQGLMGFNVRTLGVSRDQIMAAAQRVKGAFILVMDDPDLVRSAKAAGMRVIYRQSGDEQLPASDKDADIKAAAYAFVGTRAEKGADVIHFTNEQGHSHKLHVFTKYCYQCCHENGWIGVGYNYATHTPRQEWEDPEGIEVMRYAAQTGQFVGAHAYMDGVDDGVAFPFLALKQKLGLRMILTEFAQSRDLVTKRGWRGISTPTQRRDFIAKWVSWMVENNIPAQFFCFDPWDQPTPDRAKAEGFGYWDYEDVLTSMSGYNVNNQWKEKPVPVPPVTPTYPPGTLPVEATVNLSAGVNLRSTPDASSPTNILATLPYGTRVTVFEQPSVSAGGYTFIRVNADVTLSGWCAQWVGGKDTFVPSVAPTPPSAGFRLEFPVTPSPRIAQVFGVNTTGVPDFYTRWGLPAHEGIDFGGALGAPVFAAADGVIKAINIPGQNGVAPDHAYGIHIKVTHTFEGQEYETDYCHLSAIVRPLTVKEVVTVGQQIGMIGHTGNANGQNHLHFMLRKAGNSGAGVKMHLPGNGDVLYPNDIVDPMPYLPIS